MPKRNIQDAAKVRKGRRRDKRKRSFLIRHTGQSVENTIGRYEILAQQHAKRSLTPAVSGETKKNTRFTRQPKPPHSIFSTGHTGPTYFIDNPIQTHYENHPCKIRIKEESPDTTDIRHHFRQGIFIFRRILLTSHLKPENCM